MFSTPSPAGLRVGSALVADCVLCGGSAEDVGFGRYECVECQHEFVPAREKP